MHITFLGTGTSHGVPTIDCMITNYERCPHNICKLAETNPRFRRTRSSIAIEVNGDSSDPSASRTLLVDTSQDFREQVLRERIRRIDAVLYTHGHADHIYGLPDIRSYNYRQDCAIDVYGSAKTIEILERSFKYIFDQPAFKGGGIPKVIPNTLASTDDVFASLDLLGLHITPFPVIHGPMPGVLGYRINDIAYIPDVQEIPEASLALLHDLDALIINCLRPRPHGSHLSLAQSVAYAERIAPKRCYLTHSTHDIDYRVVDAETPSWISCAYDGLRFESR